MIKRLLIAHCCIFLLVFFFGCSDNSSSLDSPRATNSFNEGWKFQLGSDSLATLSDYNDEHWSLVKIPHDWSIYGDYDKNNPSGHFGGFLPGGIGIYRKSFNFDPKWKNKELLVTFDGVYMNAEVWINDHYLGKRPNGYVSFTHTISPYLKSGKNIMVVKVNNDLQPNSRWYTGSGIYRNIWLTAKNKTSIANDGTFVFGTDVSAKSAKINVETKIDLKDSESVALSLVSNILNPDGETVATMTTDTTLSLGTERIIYQSCDLTNPSLWSPDTPMQYTLVSKIIMDNKTIDQYETRFGLRDIRFDKETGFWLNGENIKVKGVNNHHDAGPVGAAVPDDVLHRRLKILKAMGCNAIRTSHNPFSPEFYNMCDSMGFLVMDEIFDEWISSWPWVDYKDRGKVEYGYHLQFEEWAQRDLKDVVIRDRNHPSIFMWSVGNEIPDQCYAEGPERLKPLMNTVHSLDSTRPVTAGCCFIHFANASGFASLLDVTGYNGGGGSVFYEKDKPVYPNRKFIATEVPHSFQTRGIYKTKTVMRSPHQGIPVPDLTEEELFPEFSPFYSSSYDNASVRIGARDSWRRTDSLPFMSGEFRWTGYDYLGESIKGWPARFWNFGIIDICGFPKDTYYFYQSQWTEEPMVHVLPHWTWPDKEGMTIPVWTYANCEEVELYLNGKSLGAKSNKDKMNLAWDVSYQPGELKAVGRNNGVVVAEKVMVTAGEPTEIVLSVDNELMQANGRSCAHVEVTVRDEQGNEVPIAANNISFTLSGPIMNIGVDNGDPLDLASTKINERKLFNGKGLMIVQSTGKAGVATIEASSPGLKSSKISLKLLSEK